jgi:hypothetical protein
MVCRVVVLLLVRELMAPLIMVVCNVVVYSLVVLLVVRELMAATTGVCVFYSGIFLKGEKF